MSRKSPAVPEKLPFSLKLAASYLLLSGLFGISLFFFKFMPEHKEFVAQSLGYKVQSYAREIIFNLMCITSSIGLFYRQVWARKLALIYLAVSTYYESAAFAWGFAGGRPTIKLFLLGFAVIGTLNGILFYIIYRKKTAVHFKQAGSQRDVWWTF